MKAQCRDCQFWQQYKDPSGNMPALGFCLRYPPVPVARSETDTETTRREVISVTITSEWPETRETEWCGEFRKDDGA